MTTNILQFDTVALDIVQEESGANRPALKIIDQTKLPGKLEFLFLTELEEIREAIYLLKVRGAPAIGVAAAIGIYVIANGIETQNLAEFEASFEAAKKGSLPPDPLR